LGLPWYSSKLSGILGAEVDDVWDEPWRGSFVKRLYLPAKPSPMGIDMDGLPYPLHWPGLIADRRCLILSLQWVVAPLGGCKASPSIDIDEELSASMPTLLNLIWGKSFLP
jgi:hypothetical protein